MGDTYWPEGTLADLLDIHVQNYEDDYREYWGLDSSAPPEGVEPDDWELAKLLDQLGSKLLRCAELLRVDPELAEVIQQYRPGDSVRNTVSHLSKYSIAQTRVEIELAGAAVGRLFQGKDRLLHVLAVLSDFRLSERATAYVDRMVKCYVLGLDTEGAVMARAVVESALEDVVSDATMASLGFNRRKYGYEFWQYREAAQRLSLLDDKGVANVEAIRRAGNDAAHAAPGLHPDPLETLLRAVVCLRQLFPAGATE